MTSTKRKAGVDEDENSGTSSAFPNNGAANAEQQSSRPRAKRAKVAHNTEEVASSSSSTIPQGQTSVPKLSRLAQKHAIVTASGGEIGTDGQVKGQVRSRSDGRLELLEGEQWVIVSRLNDLRRVVIERSAQQGSYDVSRLRGLGETDVTSFVPSMRSWGHNRENWPAILFQPKVEINRSLSRNIPLWRENGTLLIDHNNHPVRRWEGILPDTISSAENGSILEAYCRQDHRIRLADILARMPAEILQANGATIPLFKVNAISMEKTRFRREAGLLSLHKRAGSGEIDKGLESILPTNCLEENSTQPLNRLLDKDEIKQIQKSNKGKFPGKRRVTKRSLAECEQSNSKQQDTDLAAPKRKRICLQNDQSTTADSLNLTSSATQVDILGSLLDPELFQQQNTGSDHEMALLTDPNIPAVTTQDTAGCVNDVTADQSLTWQTENDLQNLLPLCSTYIPGLAPFQPSTAPAEEHPSTNSSFEMPMSSNDDVMTLNTPSLTHERSTPSSIEDLTADEYAETVDYNIDPIHDDRSVAIDRDLIFRFLGPAPASPDSNSAHMLNPIDCVGQGRTFEAIINSIDRPSETRPQTRASTYVSQSPHDLISPEVAYAQETISIFLAGRAREEARYLASMGAEINRGNNLLRVATAQQDIDTQQVINTQRGEGTHHEVSQQIRQANRGVANLTETWDSGIDSTIGLAPDNSDLLSSGNTDEIGADVAGLPNIAYDPNLGFGPNGEWNGGDWL